MNLTTKENFTTVQGPSGTGKTIMIVAMLYLAWMMHCNAQHLASKHVRKTGVWRHVPKNNCTPLTYI